MNKTGIIPVVTFNCFFGWNFTNWPVKDRTFDVCLTFEDVCPKNLLLEQLESNNLLQNVLYMLKQDSHRWTAVVTILTNDLWLSPVWLYP